MCEASSVVGDDRDLMDMERVGAPGEQCDDTMGGYVGVVCCVVSSCVYTVCFPCSCVIPAPKDLCALCH